MLAPGQPFIRCPAPPDAPHMANRRSVSKSGNTGPRTDRLNDEIALADLMTRVSAKNNQQSQEPLPDPTQWAIRPDHESDQGLFEELCFHMFSAGFSGEVVRKKWPATRQAFKGFAPDAVARIRESTIAQLANDKGLIRNRRKLRAVVDNAKQVLALAGEFGSFRAWLDGFPADALYLAHGEIAKRFACVGPSAAEWFLLTSGYDYYFATDHARRMLFRLGLTSREKPSREELNGVFMALAAATGGSPWAASAELFLFASGFRLTEAICAEQAPLCPKCPLWDHCDHFNQRR